MLGRHRRISEELLYLARRRIYSNRRVSRAPVLPSVEDPHGAMGPTLHDSWALPVMRSIGASEVSESEELEADAASVKPAVMSK
jgi:hypothetical protein